MEKMKYFSKKCINIPRGAHKLHPSQLRRDRYLSRRLLYTTKIIILSYKNQNTARVYMHCIIIIVIIIITMHL